MNPCPLERRDAKHGMRGMLVRWILPLVLAAAAAAGAQAADSKTVIVLIDLSDSTTAYRKDYRAYFGKILDACGSDDVLIAAKIASNPFAASNIVARLEFPGFWSSLSESQVVQKARLDKARKNVLQSVDASLAGISTQTPILDSLLLTERQFAAFPNKRRVLVILSDMKEYAGRGKLNFEDPHTPLGRADIDKLLTRLEAERRIPNLAGVKVVVAGARTRDEGRYRTIRDFWLAYFAKAGARLDPNDYGPDLLNFAP